MQIKAVMESEVVIMNTLYRSPSTKNPDKFFEDLENILGNTTEKFKYSLLVGDMNIDLLQTDFSHNYSTILHELGYLSAINTVTRPLSGTCKNHIFLNSKYNEYDTILSATVESDIIDHLIIALQIVFPNNNIKIKKHHKIIKQFNEEKFKQKIKKANWSDVLTNGDLDTATSKFIDIIQDALKSSEKSRKINSKNNRKKEWIINSLVKSINQRNKLYKNLKQDPDNE
ncbi:hypothetical protein JTB14_011494 [Gonioctena quinquepunctata]|nr:hypothetical protein JTB14_011494 [Gonioctena quinquepunctata]